MPKKNIAAYVKHRLYEIAAEHERLKRDLEMRRLAWRDTGHKVTGIEFKELNAAIDALGRFEAEHGIEKEGF